MTANPRGLHASYRRSEALGDEITELFGFITAATYELLVLIREFDQQKLWELDGVCSCAHWLNWKCGIGMNAAREKVRVANELAALPGISEAFSMGTISYSKARAMTRVATPENEDFLMKIARHGTAYHVETVVRGYRRAKQLNDAESANRQFRSRSLDYHYDDDGSLVLKGRLPAEVGAMLIKALDEAVDLANSEQDVSAETPVESRPTFAARRADALARITESYLESGDQPSSSADRYQVMVHVSAETLTPDVSAETSASESCYIEDGPHVSAETAQRLCCDRSISRLVEDRHGTPLTIGRKSRVIPPSMRRALRARDKGCRFPGCTHTYSIDGHHIRHWANGGETSLDNLVLLCRRHHRLVHEGGFGCEREPGGRIFFRNRLGERISNSAHESPTNPENPVHQLQEKLEDRRIHSKTCVTKWQGEKMDRALAVELLWQEENSNKISKQGALYS